MPKDTFSSAVPARASAARDISYAHAGQSPLGRGVIRCLENSTGRLGLIRRAHGYQEEAASGRDFWQVMLDRFGLSLRIRAGALQNIPRTGPLVLVANHPYGILDGLVMGHLLAQRRGDFRILAHQVFAKAPDLTRVILPVSFDQTEAAMRQNLATRSAALRYLQQGGAIGVFPGGTVSTSARIWSQPLDPVWRSFTARMIARSGATVVPVYFDGHCSRLFQIASHLHPNLRMGLLIREFARRVDQPVDLHIGPPLPAEEIRMRQSESKALMDFLRKSTYELSPKPMQAQQYGYEFEQQHKAGAEARPQAFKG